MTIARVHPCDFTFAAECFISTTIGNGYHNMLQQVNHANSLTSYITIKMVLFMSDTGTISSVIKIGSALHIPRNFKGSQKTLKAFHNLRC